METIRELLAAFDRGEIEVVELIIEATMEETTKPGQASDTWRATGEKHWTITTRPT